MPSTAIKLRVTYTDGRDVEVLAGPRAQVDFERHFKMSMGEAGSMEHLYYLAWTALHLAGKEPLDFDQWLDVLAEVDQIGDDEVPLNPTPEAQP